MIPHPNNFECSISKVLNKNACYFVLVALTAHIVEEYVGPNPKLFGANLDNFLTLDLAPECKLSVWLTIGFASARWHNTQMSALIQSAITKDASCYVNERINALRAFRRMLGSYLQACEAELARKGSKAKCPVVVEIGHAARELK